MNSTLEHSSTKRADRRRVTRIALPANASNHLHTLSERYRPVAGLERLVLKAQMPATVSKDAWMRGTPEGKVAAAKSARMTLSVGYDAAIDWLHQEYLAYLRANDALSPTHGAARASPPPTYVVGDLIAKAIEFAGDRLESWIEERERELQRIGRNAMTDARRAAV